VPPAALKDANFSPVVENPGQASQPLGYFQQPKDPFLFGYVNRVGDVIIPPKFKSAWYFSEGLAPVAIEATDKTYRYGFINTNGNYVIRPKYAFAGLFSEGLASVEVLQKKNKSDVFGMYGCIDHAGNLVVKPRFKFIGQFHDGLAVAEPY
jgi:hypothetical protein